MSDLTKTYNLFIDWSLMPAYENDTETPENSTIFAYDDESAWSQAKDEIAECDIDLKDIQEHIDSGQITLTEIVTRVVEYPKES
jgi:hypothetical protein